MKMAGLIEAADAAHPHDPTGGLPAMKMAGLIEAESLTSMLTKLDPPSGHEDGRPH